jgi:hypothetical protein
MLRVDTNSFILNREQPGRNVAANVLGANVDTRRFSPMKFQGVPDQVLEYLRQLPALSIDGRQEIGRNNCAGSINGGLEVMKHLFDDEVAVDRRDFFLTACPRIRQQVLDHGSRTLRALQYFVNSVVRCGIRLSLEAVQNNFRKSNDLSQRFLQGHAPRRRRIARGPRWSG